MNDLIYSIEVLITDELSRASEEWGEKHNSPHEAYGVILEEFTEALDEGNRLNKCMAEYLRAVMENRCHDLLLDDMLTTAKLMIAETIQCAAMIRKAQRGYVK